MFLKTQKPVSNFSRIIGRWITSWLVVSGMIVSSGLVVNAQTQTDDDKPLPIGSKLRTGIDLVDQEPFDRLFLDEYNGNAQLDIVPLVEIPQKPFPDRGNLVFELMDGSWPTLQVPWENLVEFKTFDQLLLEEADQLIQDAKFAKAFRNLLYVLDRTDGGSPELEAKIQTVLFLDGKSNYEAGNYGLALSVFEDLYRRNPRFKIQGISLSAIDLILDCYRRSLRQFADKEDFRSVRLLLASLQKTYKKAADPLVAEWETEFRTRYDELIAEAKAKLANEEIRLARVAARKAINVLPTEQEAYEIYDSIVAQHPIVFVGTSQPALNPNPNRIEDWASRRVGRLTQRRIVELTGLSEEGGRYEFTNGRFYQTDEFGLKYRFEIDPEKQGFAIPPLESYQLRSILLKYADPNNPIHIPAWAKIVKSVAVTGQYTVDVELRLPFVRPDALLNFPYAEYEDNSQDVTGPYLKSESSEDLITFDVNPKYAPSAESQFPKLVEWLYGSPSDAVDALRKGLVDAVDRVPPGDVADLRMDPDIEVRSYLVPTVHMLVPNIRNDFTKAPTFRSALLKGINREEILMTMCDKKRIDGMEVINGPFPIGSDENPQIAYAYNSRVAPVQFSRMIGRVLVEVVRQTLEGKMIQKGEIVQAEGDVPFKLEIPELVLAHPKGDVPSIACTAISRMWNQLGIKTRLVELPPGVTIPDNDDYDFLYVELTMTEPLADADFLFGSQGVVNDLSAPIEQMMRQVNVSNSWRAASNNLKQLHRQILNDVAVLPLWQMREHYAHRRNVRDVGRDLMFLYQYVDRWQIGALNEKSK